METDGRGFGIYIKTNDGLKLIDFVTEKNYTYRGNTGNTNLVIKTEYRNFKKNASDGITANIVGKVFDNNEKENNDSITPNITIIGGNKQNITIGNYTEKNITVTYKGKDITDKCKIEYIIDKQNYNTFLIKRKEYCTLSTL